MNNSVNNVNNSKRIVKIVITGGPCGGKSTLLPKLKIDLPDYGWTPLIVHETASELITGGIAPWTCKSNLEYHLIQMKLQLVKEQLAQQAAEGMDADNIVILCDRGLLDARACMSEGEFRQACNILNYTDNKNMNTFIDTLSDRYSAVFHLDTVANGYSEFYTLANNEARHESIQEAIHQDELTRLAWEGKKNWFLIQNSYNFDTKMCNAESMIICYLKTILI